MKNVASSGAEMQLVTFNLGDESFGIDIMEVQEIIRLPEITKVPKTATYIEGVANLRGKILPIIDTRSRFGMSCGNSDDSKRVIVVDVNGQRAGLDVDSVSQVLRVDGRSIDAAPGNLAQGIDRDSISGVLKLNNGQKLVMILDSSFICDGQAPIFDDHIGDEPTREMAAKQAEEDVLLVSFQVGSEEFGLEINKVKEIIRFPDIVKVPNVPYYITGIISLRDYLIPVVDLRSKLGVGTQEVTPSTRVVVVDVEGCLIGLTVDQVFEVMRVPLNKIFQPPQMICSDGGANITGIVRLQDGKRIIMLMDLQDIISQPVLDEIGQPGSGSGEELVNNRFTIDETDEEQMVVFSLASEQYGIRINQVQEINRLSKITKVPRAPHYVEGVVNLRGEVIPVIDLRKRFELESNEHNQFTRIIVSDIHNKKVGIIVDAVLEVLRVGKTRIESPPDICETQGSERFLDGIANLQERMIMMINLENLLQDKEWKKLEKISQTGNQAAPSSGAKLNKQR